MNKFTSSTEVDGFVHVPVLMSELITGLNISSSGHYLDATVGGGGHTRLILETFPDVRVTAIDRDPMAIAAAAATLQEYGNERLQFWQGNFAEYQPPGIKFDGIIADLGVSSAQLDLSERGFSFRHSAPLDMRMDRSQSLTAAEIVNHWDEKSLADIFYQYGEEKLSRRIANKIVAQRPFQTTTELAYAIAGCFPRKSRFGRIHPATRTFQALRIVVNGELDSLKKFLDVAPQWLKIGGIIGIISFHSLEDRLVKYAFRDSSYLQVLTKKPIISQADEVENNPRSRSAKLRFAQRISLE